MNIVLLTKWMDRIMGPQEDIAIIRLWDNEGKGLNWRVKQPQSKKHHHFGEV